MIIGDAFKVVLRCYFYYLNKVFPKVIWILSSTFLSEHFNFCLVAERGFPWLEIENYIFISMFFSGLITIQSYLINIIYGKKEQPVFLKTFI